MFGERERVVIGVANAGGECFYVTFVVNGWDSLLVVGFPHALSLG